VSFVGLALVVATVWLGFAGPTCAEPLSGAGFTGTVTKSNTRAKGQRFTFANIRSDRPFVTYPTGHGDHATKVFEDDELVVLFFVGYLTGSTEMFYLDVDRRRFTLIEVGVLDGRHKGGDLRPDVTFGDLE
jgi:hypothetical protein